MSANRRIACLDIPALPLQILLRREPSWRIRPVVVLSEDLPQGVIQWANALARSQRILPGMTFSAGRSLCFDLHAAAVDQEEVESIVDDIHVRLLNFAPHVEPASEAGVFWIDPSGLTSLYGSLDGWANTLVANLHRSDWDASIVVGYHRYRTYALARTLQCPPRRRGMALVISSRHHEARLAGRVPLQKLNIDSDLRDQLHVLGVRRLGDFLRLPPAELALRFGNKATALHTLASDQWHPVKPRELIDPVGAELHLDPPDTSQTRLLFGIKGALHKALKKLASRNEAAMALHLRFELDHADTHEEFIEPAQPTLDVLMLLDLIRLRLELLAFPAAVAQVQIRIEGIRVNPKQLALFHTQQRRDLDAATLALDRIRALLGSQAVVRAQLRPAHLPEASFCWVPVQHINFPSCPATSSPVPLCRRLFPRAILLPAPPRRDPERWMGKRHTAATAEPGEPSAALTAWGEGREAPPYGLEQYGVLSRLHGPYRVSGAWWVRTVERDYYYAEMQHGEVLWIYYDRPRRSWFLHGYLD